MRLNKILSVSILALFFQSCQSAPSEPEQVRQVVALQHIKAQDMADTINGLLREDSHPGNPIVVVKAEPGSNSVLITGDPKRVSQTVVLVSRLDVKKG